MKTPLQMLSETSQSPAMQTVLKSITGIATSDLGILLVGEPGTGKEWIARKIHQMGSRSTGRFISVDCTSLPPGLVEQEIFGLEQFTPNGVTVDEGVLEDAEGGTVFLSGFSSLPLEVQMKVARAGAHQKFHRVGGRKELWYNGRTIVAVNQAPSENLPTGLLQKDILNRLSPIVIELPPLRKRREDLLALLNLFISQTNERYGATVRGITPEALKICLTYTWPGNIRELRNMAEYAVIMARNQLILPAHLPLQMQSTHLRNRLRGSFRKGKSVAAVEKYLILEALRSSSTKKEAAEQLGISVRTLTNRLEQYDLDEELGNHHRVDEDDRTRSKR
ncbi:MAG: sigma-54-dependent Fis family transcriptional regulator [Ignavibacteriales bacterium]|nr:sigma-54-dependent Fis family transcriptional regulator [Ignavibacteriales bacterium]